jgi:hypothetical protein
MSKIEVDAIDKQSGSTLTLGGSGTAVTLACGATQSGFGRSGSVNWQTSIKTTGFTAVSGEGYFCDTSSGAFTLTLPASPSAGDIVSISDYAKTFDTETLTIGRNSSNIAGIAQDSLLTTEGIAVTLVYADATKGWLVTESGLQSEAPGPEYMVASGGTTTTCGDFKIHTFTGPGCFQVTCAGNSAGNNAMEYLVVAGGGSGGNGDGTHGGGGGGAGGFRFASPSLAPATYPAKPLAAPTTLTATAETFPITVGAGGAGGNSPGSNYSNNGSNSVFSTITSAGGGGGGGETFPGDPGKDGGSGGGAQVDGTTCFTGAGNVPSVSPAQGTPGGFTVTNPTGGYIGGGGGGGAIQAGQPAPGGSGPNNAYGGPGGNGGGLPTAFGSNGVPCGSFRYYAGGGGASSRGCVPSNATGGKGGGGAASPSGGCAGTTNSGGGGGSGHGSGAGSAGGSGVVIIRYKFQN